MLNDQLMLDKNFVHCSTMIAELLMKYKGKGNRVAKKNDEPEIGSLLFCVFGETATNRYKYQFNYSFDALKEFKAKETSNSGFSGE